MPLLKKALTNKSIWFVFTRYVTFGLSFINSMFIAVFLGPVNLGIWGFFNMVLQYLTQFNLGIPQSLQAILSTEKKRTNYVANIIGNSFVLTGFLSLVVCLLIALNHFFHLNFGVKYDFEVYALPLLVAVVCTYFSTLYINIFRIYGLLNEVIFFQSGFPIIVLLEVLCLSSNNFLSKLIYSYMGFNILSLIIFTFRCPVKITFIWDRHQLKYIQKRGWHLFLYASSFFFIILSTRSFVSGYYSAEEFGYFTFAFSFANAMLLLISAFAFLLNPKLLNYFSTSDLKKTQNALHKLRNIFLVSMHLFFYIGFAIFPWFLVFFSKYKASFYAFILLSLTVMLQVHSFGYTNLLIAKNKERKMGLLAIAILVFNVLACFVLVQFMRVEFSEVVFGTLISFMIYIYFLCRMGRRQLRMSIDFFSILFDVFPVRLLIPYCLTIFFVLIKAPNLFYLTPLVVGCVLNIPSIKDIIATGKNIVGNSNFIDF